MARELARDAAGIADRESMIRLEGGTFMMGSDRHYLEEAPRHAVRIEGFWIDRAPVTNAEFARFVDDTDHVTTAEIAPDRLLAGYLPVTLLAKYMSDAGHEHAVKI